MRMMTDLWGGAPYSRLFTVVREQMSLCYYCAARYQTVKGAIMVDSGIEVEHMEKAREGILSQLEVMQQGGFDDAAFQASRKGLTDSARGVSDSAARLEGWYVHRMFDDTPDTPEDFVRRIEGMTRESIADAARKVGLGAVYVLRGRAHRASVLSWQSVITTAAGPRYRRVECPDSSGLYCRPEEREPRNTTTRPFRPVSGV